MMDSAMDDGDLARLLKRTIDLPAQVYYQAYRFSIIGISCVFSIFGLILFYHYHLHYVIRLDYVPDSEFTRHRSGSLEERTNCLHCHGPSTD